MKRVVSVLMIVSSIITSIFIICTFVTSYHFYYLGSLFDSYRAVQVGTAVTLFFLGIRCILNNYGIKKIIYSIISFSIACIFLILSIIVK